MAIKTKLWKQLEFGITSDSIYLPTSDGLLEISESKLGRKIPELNLWLSVLIDAAKHRDMKFLNKWGAKICEKAKLDYRTVYAIFKNIWEKENG